MTITDSTPKTFSKAELAKRYKVSATTFRKWLADVGLKSRNKVLKPFEVGMIFQRYGQP